MTPHAAMIRSNTIFDCLFDLSAKNYTLLSICDNFLALYIEAAKINTVNTPAIV